MQKSYDEHINGKITKTDIEREDNIENINNIFSQTIKGVSQQQYQQRNVTTEKMSKDTKRLITKQNEMRSKEPNVLDLKKLNKNISQSCKTRCMEIYQRHYSKNCRRKQGYGIFKEKLYNRKEKYM